ncbi:hypothetical protein MPSEU_000229600 [Mayamaea pseudoterrestris]|nr:hypothetical protein MPSEU_000229600 [Mayamaea pseudoterrestris]
MDVPEAVILDHHPADDTLDDRNISISSNSRHALPFVAAPTSSITQQQPPQANKRLYRVAENKWVTRDIAALDFLLNIPLQAEAKIVRDGYLQQTKQQEEYESTSSSDENNHRSSDHRILARSRSKQEHNRQASILKPGDFQGKWWEKWITGSLLQRHGRHYNNNPSNSSHHNSSETSIQQHLLLEGPTRRDKIQPSSLTYTPGRRLEGDDAIRISVPVTTSSLTKQRTIARMAALREWEKQTAHGGTVKTTVASSGAVSKTPANTSSSSVRDYQPPLLDGRLFFSASGSYPVSLMSIVRYEPKREEAQLRRLKLEACGGGGSEFRIPSRGDWRGISYRSLLPRKEYKEHEKHHGAFNRFVLRKNGDNEDDSENDYDDDDTSLSSEDSDVYVPGILDDPDMVLGRHRNVMVGDRVIGPIIASTIQFVEPALLKADLNKQFRERFDGWEPSKSALKYIGARVINGNYVLTEPIQDEDEEEKESMATPIKTRKRQSSTASSLSSDPTANNTHSEKLPTEKQVRMPPSLTLSKIRSLKHQALQVAVKANIEIGTVSLACVNFERLCLDCRVDKSNRRLAFAACLLLASKLNEPNVSLVMQVPEAGINHDGEGKANRFTSFVRPNNRGSTMFASLLEFFTQEWEIGLKQLFDAEWGVFAALGFDLHAQPSQVAFHFKRFMKTLEWSPKNYLGAEMYGYWQESLDQEEDRRRALERRKARLKHRKEEELLNLHIEIEHDLLRRKIKNGSDDSSIQDSLSDAQHEQGRDSTAEHIKKDPASPHKVLRKSSGINFFQRFGMRRIMSAETLFNPQLADNHGQIQALPLYENATVSNSDEHGSSDLGPSSHFERDSGSTGLLDSAEAIVEQPFDIESGVLEMASDDSVDRSNKGR